MLVLRRADVYTRELRALVGRKLISPRRPVVLVVEAETERRNFFVAALNDARCVAFGVSSPRVARQLLADLWFDAVLLEQGVAAQLLALAGDQPPPRLIALTKGAEEGGGPGFVRRHPREVVFSR